MAKSNFDYRILTSEMVTRVYLCVFNLNNEIKYHVQKCLVCKIFCFANGAKAGNSYFMFSPAVGVKVLP